MDATQHYDRAAIVDRLDGPSCEIQCEVRITVSDFSRQIEGRPLIDVVDIGKPLRAQQLTGDVLGGETDAGVLQDPHRGRFEGTLLGHCLRHPSKASGAGK
jgi:hypothetical protein